MLPECKAEITAYINQPCVDAIVSCNPTMPSGMTATHARSRTFHPRSERKKQVHGLRNNNRVEMRMLLPQNEQLAWGIWTRANLLFIS